MIKNRDIELKVCNKCDAPLPCDANNLNFFTKNTEICDDCIEIER